MTELICLDIITGPWNNEAGEDQSEDKDSNDGEDIIPDPNKISGIPQEYQATVNGDPV